MVIRTEDATIGFPRPTVTAEMTQHARTAVDNRAEGDLVQRLNQCLKEKTQEPEEKIFHFSAPVASVDITSRLRKTFHQLRGLVGCSLRIGKVGIAGDDAAFAKDADAVEVWGFDLEGFVGEFDWN